MDAPRIFERILIGVDSEGFASNAVLMGATLSRTLGSALDLVHAVEVPPPLWLGITEDELADMHAAALARARDTTIENLAVPLRGLSAQSLLGLFALCQQVHRYRLT